MAKLYPEEVVIGDIKLKKSADELYVELQSELLKADIDKFLIEHKKVLQWEFEPEDRKALTLQYFNRASLRSKWLKRAEGTEDPIERISGRIERDQRVRIVGPIYFREDLEDPIGFAFDDRFIVRFKARASRKELQIVFKEVGVEKVEAPRGELGEGMVLVRLCDAKKQNAFEVARRLSESKIIESANVNFIQLGKATLAVPNDTYFSKQWNLSNTGQIMPDGNNATIGCDINVEQAWDISKGSPLVVIAVLDTGCDLGHPELLPNLVQQDRWYNAETGNNSPDDDFGHGTCCAGIASALTNSLTAQGVAGVGWHCRVMPVRMVWNFGYSIGEPEILNALDHALKNHANIIIMSWEWKLDKTNIDILLQKCVDAGIVLVAAAGNDAVGKPNTIAYPASNVNVIAVGATNEDDRRCRKEDWPLYTGSQYGPELSVVAPGVHTWTTDMQGAGKGFNNVLGGGGDTAGDYFENFFGTSCATPHVGGLAGLILAYNPTLTPQDVRKIIENTADDQVGDPGEDTAGRDDYMGHGRIDAHAAMVEVQNNYPFQPVDVFIRDSLSDSGVEPYTGSPLCYSPDIIVRKNPVANPQTAFSDMTVDPGSDNVEIGNNSYIYIRVHNKGPVNSNIHARIYCAPLSTTCSPDLWQYLGQIDFYDVPAGGNAVSDTLVWPNVPDAGSVDHFCIIASIEGFRDPHPNPTGISNDVEYMQFVRDHNNICYRNVVFQNVLPLTTIQLNFFLTAFKKDHHPFDLRIEREVLSPDTRIDIRLHDRFFKAMNIQLDNAVERMDKPIRGYRVFEFKESKQSALKGLQVAPRSRKPVQVNIKIPKSAKTGELYRLAVRQVYEGEVVGEFYIEGRVLDPRDVKFIGVRSDRSVHKATCRGLEKIDRDQWVPFKSLEDAKATGYDMARDCLMKNFTAKQVSWRLAQRVLYFLNRVELAGDVVQYVKRSLSRQYFEKRYGREGVKKRGDAFDRVARKILKARDEMGRFSRLEQIEKLKGIRPDDLVDLVNSFK